MLTYFSKFIDIKEVNNIYLKINQLKERIANGDYSNYREEFDSCSEWFKSIISKAKSINDEKLANSSKVFELYFEVFVCLSRYFKSLDEREYKESWNYLQDCIDSIRYVCRFTEERYELQTLLELLCEYEKLYPYKTFCSREQIVSKSHCSICGKSMLGLDCPHIKGNIYWGEIAVEHIDKIKEIQAICLVSHPEDKRCIVELSDDERSDKEKFKALDLFIDMKLPHLVLFSTRSIIEYRCDKAVANRNDKCPCGSGLKYKKWVSKV